MNKVLRWSIALISAALISYTLFAAFEQLVGNSGDDFSISRPAISIKFAPIHKTRPKQAAIPTPPKVNHDTLDNKQMQKPPPTITPRETKPVSIAKHTPADRTDRTATGIQPIFRTEPIYPMFAITRGLEGWVTIEFAITENGTVLNPEVVASEPPEVFEQTALNAVSKWRYPPANANKSSVHIKFELRDN